MRTLTAGFLLLLTACSAGTNPAIEEAAQERANAELVNGMYRAFARGDVPGVLAALAPDVEWIEADGSPYPGTFRGPDAVLEGVFARLGAEWDGFRAVPTAVLADGEQVVAYGEYSGAYKATGKSFRAAFAHVWTVEDGRVTRFQQIADTEMMQRAVRGQ